VTAVGLHRFGAGEGLFLFFSFVGSVNRGAEQDEPIDLLGAQMRDFDGKS